MVYCLTPRPVVRELSVGTEFTVHSLESQIKITVENETTVRIAQSDVPGIGSNEVFVSIDMLQQILDKVRR